MMKDKRGENMRKLILLFIMGTVISSFAFSQDIETPAFMIELSAGCGMGINLDNVGFFDIKLLYPFGKFGFALESGGMFSANDGFFHTFLGPMVFLINKNKWRVPLIIGADIFGNNSIYLGLGAIFAAHYSLTKNIYVGVNFETTYAINHVYQEYVGDQIIVTKFDDGSTKTQTIKQYKDRNHYGNNFYFKPSILFGLQF